MSAAIPESETALAGTSETDPSGPHSITQESFSVNKGHDINKNATADSPSSEPVYIMQQQSKSGEESSTESTPAPSTVPANGSNSHEFNVQDLRCPICMDFYIEPELTDCAHTFCRYCIHLWFANRGRNICPQCRATIRDTVSAQELSTKVEEYVALHLSKELQDERESTKEHRRQASANWRNRTRNPNRGNTQQGTLPDIYAGYEDWEDAFPLLSYSMNSYGTPPTELPRNRSQSRNNNNSNTTEANNMQNLLNEFEFRLERARRSYGLVVSAQREMNHQLEHLRSISQRLERYDRLLNRNRRNLTTSAGSDDNNNTSGTTNSTNDYNNNERDSLFDLSTSNLLEDDILDQIPNYTNGQQQHHVNYHYMDPHAMWHWLAAPQNYSTSFNAARFYQPQSVAEVNVSTSVTPSYLYAGSLYDYPDSAATAAHNYSLAFQGQYQDADESSTATSTVPTTTDETPTIISTPRVRTRRRHCFNRHSSSRHNNSHQHHHCHNSNINTVDPHPRHHPHRHHHQSTLNRSDQDEDDFLEELSNQLGESRDLAEAIERSLVLEMLNVREPSVESIQQVSVRSSRLADRRRQDDLLGSCLENGSSRRHHTSVVNSRLASNSTDFILEMSSHDDISQLDLDSEGHRLLATHAERETSVERRERVPRHISRHHRQLRL